MKMNCKKLWISLLACLLCMSMLVACGGSDTATTATSDTSATSGTTGGTEPETPERLLKLVENGETNYRIVVPKNAKDYEWDAAYNVRIIILTMTGCNPSIVEDTTAPEEKEIVIGANNSRNTLYTAPVAYNGGFCTFISGDRIIIEARSELGMKRAVQDFGKDCFGVNIVFPDFYKGEELSELTVSASYQNSEVFDVTSYLIVNDGSVMQRRLAYTWISQFNTTAGSKYFVEAAMSTTKTDDPDIIQIEICEQSTLTNGQWELHKTDANRYQVCAGDYYGFTAAAKTFRSYVANNRGTDQPFPSSMVGSYLDEGVLKSYEESTRYAFTHTGEYRVMFNNVLFGDPNGAQRSIFNAEIASIYMPDVYGLQEVNYGRRDDAADGNGGIIKELAALGYVETIDPRVQNAYGTKEDIPGTDAEATTGSGAGTPLKGYGTSGARPVTVDNETFYTYYNHTPLLYNTNTTKCIASDYYWYKSQWDKRPGKTHDNGSSDCGSKSLTWGVFEDLESGERYIVISTHMCTRSDYIRGLQAVEAVELINGLIEEYDCPVIFGGDYNGNYTSSNYTYFKANGLADPRADKLASLYTTSVPTHHPYPVYDFDYKLVIPADGDNGSSSGGSVIDHIMVKNHESMEFFVCGTVIDEIALTNADHYPIFIDFSINSQS